LVENAADKFPDAAEKDHLGAAEKHNRRHQARLASDDVAVAPLPDGLDQQEQHNSRTHQLTSAE